MDWSKLFGALAGSAAASMVLHKWLKIEKLDVLRLTIYNDIREFTPESVEVMIGLLDEHLKMLRFSGDSKSLDHTELVKQVLLEQAERRGLL